MEQSPQSFINKKNSTEEQEHLKVQFQYISLWSN